MIAIEVLGINIKRNPDWSRPTCIFAFGDIGLPDLQTTLRGCALAKSNGRVIVMPPKLAGAHPGDLAAVQWNTSSPFAAAVKDKLMTAYEAMGGIIPAAKQKPAPIERMMVPAAFIVHGEEADDVEAVEGLARTLSVEHQEAARVLG